MVDGANVYAYCGNDPVNQFDPDGRAYFAQKPLRDDLWIPLASHNLLDDYLNTEISHEQIFFEDQEGGNIGFTFDDSYGIRGLFGVASGVLWEDTNPTGYRITRTGYNDELIREAVCNVHLRRYQLLYIGKSRKYNCQDWAEAVRTEYRRLEAQHYMSKEKATVKF